MSVSFFFYFFSICCYVSPEYFMRTWQWVTTGFISLNRLVCSGSFFDDVSYYHIYNCCFPFLVRVYMIAKAIAASCSKDDTLWNPIMIFSWIVILLCILCLEAVFLFSCLIRKNKCLVTRLVWKL